MIRVQGLTKEFASRRGVRPAVTDLSFVCTPGRITGLLGPNGAGKTTTLRILATLLRPTSGSVEVAGVDVQADPGEVRRRIGFATGETELYTRLTPRETLRFFGHLSGTAFEACEGRITELAHVFGFSDVLDTRIESLSSGTRQKVSLARAAIHDAPVLILDEPTTALDVVTARGVLSFLRRARDAGKTVLLSSHSMYEVDALCDSVVLMDRGRLLASGSIPEILSATGTSSLQDVFFKTEECHDAV